MDTNPGLHVFTWRTAKQCILLELRFGVGVFSQDTMG